MNMSLPVSGMKRFAHLGSSFFFIPRGPIKPPDCLPFSRIDPRRVEPYVWLARFPYQPYTVLVLVFGYSRLPSSGSANGANRLAKIGSDLTVSFTNGFDADWWVPCGERRSPSAASRPLVHRCRWVRCRLVGAFAKLEYLIL